jgi:hypothetical protein
VFQEVCLSKPLSILTKNPNLNLRRRFPAPKRNEQPNATILFLFHSWISLAFARFFRVDQSAKGQETEPLFLDHYRGIGDESFFAWCRGI